MVGKGHDDDDDDDDDDEAKGRPERRKLKAQDGAAGRCCRRVVSPLPNNRVMPPQAWVGLAVAKDTAVLWRCRTKSLILAAVVVVVVVVVVQEAPAAAARLMHYEPS